ncbi:uncharacterized protein LOC121407055 [Lytechinus variegatus]|uniref:uncharacterized protein LOC121407055 n=1 Tax=Lytechinus variegatus TaxID=7654 RepID=UPI001BB17B93|nr:uncharacterized protein LOC121407055 [Lytechinus variegatus]
MAVTWQDFTIFGSFMFFVAIGWTFKQSYEKFTRYREKTEVDEEIESVMIEQCFKRSWIEGILIATSVIVLLLIEMMPRLEKGKETPSAAIESRWFIYVIWLPYALYSVVLILCDFYSTWMRVWIKPCILFALLCEYAIVAAHLNSLPTGCDRCMYTPVCTLIYFSALVVVGELLVPEFEQLAWLRCGCSLVQGTWFVQIGCTLSMTGREWRRDEGVGLTVFIIFIWHCVLAWIVIRVLKKTVKVVSTSRPSGDNAWEYFDLYSDDEDDFYYGTKSTKNSGWMQRGGIALTPEQVIAMGYRTDYS